eukprot:SAG22_NODE_10310_length_542_cov_0.550790_1_plen_93_part_01
MVLPEQDFVAEAISEAEQFQRPDFERELWQQCAADEQAWLDSREQVLAGRREVQQQQQQQRQQLAEMRQAEVLSPVQQRAQSAEQKERSEQRE